MNVTEKLPKEKCTGCGLCFQLCPVKCITMKEDSEGFFYPHVRKDSCIDCGLCTKKCPILSESICFSDSNKAQYYAAILKDENELRLASSGGVFSALADYIISEGGYVCGCVYNEGMEAVHVVTNDRETIKKMYGSKYVQSNITECYSTIREKLNDGKKVLFTGTACQAAAIKSFFGDKYDNLYTVDILCHGVPSPGLFRLFVEQLSIKEKSKVVDVKFRDKERNGWGSEHRTSVTYENGKKIWPFLPAYFSAFFYGLDLRESCYQCKFAGTSRVSNLTIGDYWGSWAKYRKRFTEGISVLSINSKKGKKLIDAVEDKFVLLDELTQNEATTSNDNFEHPVKRPIERSSFYKKLVSHGYSSIKWKTYLAKTYRVKIVKSIYGAIIPERIRMKIHYIAKR